MLTPIAHTRYIERILNDASGRRFRVVFAVSIIDGAPSMRIISAQPLETECAGYISAAPSSSGAFCLPCAKHIRTVQSALKPSFTSFVSPYFSTEFLINTQPTRAPARA